MVLLDSDLVAVDTACCCGQCTSCAGDTIFHFGCDTGDFPDVCRTGPEQCDDPICQGDTIPCDSLWLTLNEYCIDCPGSALELCSIARVDPVTCEHTVECISRDCCASCPSGSTTQMVTDRVFPCVGACCLLGICSIQTAADCFNLFGFYQGDNTTCDPDPC